ncbi:hypothetical protein LCGC14_1128530 [marine sediment metagenome]|uniref:Uncharacterized protein n=1 Tax=marine sediment metagenome TaxID=412755 RepID=A0A0F9PK20_9ZZZZ
MKTVNETLKSIGFDRLNNGKWAHVLLEERMFDFSAVSVDGIIRTVFFKGIDEGRKVTQEEIKHALGILKARGNHG